MSDRPPQKLVVGDVSLTTGLVMNQHYESAPEGEGDRYDHDKAIPLSADGYVIPSSVRGLQVLQQDMRTRVPAPVLDVTVQAAFQQLVPPELRAAIHVLAEWDAGWFQDLEKPSVYADAGAVYSQGDKAFEAACLDDLRPWISDEGNATLAPRARSLCSHAWTIGPIRLAHGYWAGFLVRLEGLDSATGLYTRVAQVALVDPRRDDRHAAEGNRALRRLEYALAQTGLTIGNDGDDAAHQDSDAWARTAWRRTIWVPRQMDGGDGSCGPRYYVLAKTMFMRLTALWENNRGSRSGDGEPPYAEALWTTPLSGWFHHEATRWEMVGHHAARAVHDAHYQARVTAEVVRTQNGGMMPARAAMNLPPEPTYEAAPAVFPSAARATPGNPAQIDTSSLMTASTMPSALAAAAAATGARQAVPAATEPSLSQWFAPEVFPTAARLPRARNAGAAAMASSHHLPHSPASSASSASTTGTATSRKRRRASDAAASQPGSANKRCCRIHVLDAPTPPNGYPVFPSRDLDPWDWLHVRWARENPFEARQLNMHMAHYREGREAQERGDGGMGHGHGGGHGRRGSSDADDEGDDDDNENGSGEKSGGQHTSRSGPQISSSDENLDSDGELQAHIQKSIQATRESAATFRKRYDMEAGDRAREDARARGPQTQTQTPGRQQSHGRGPRAEGSPQQQQEEQ